MGNQPRNPIRDTRIVWPKIRTMLRLAIRSLPRYRISKDINKGLPWWGRIPLQPKRSHARRPKRKTHWPSPRKLIITEKTRPIMKTNASLKANPNRIPNHRDPISVYLQLQQKNPINKTQPHSQQEKYLNNLNHKPNNIYSLT